MDFGINLPTKADSWKTALRAEELGFSHVWFYDTALLNAEIFVAMGAAAVKTSRIKLCTGVLTPSNRIAPVAASGLASLNALAPGRIIFGVGTGFTARRTMGLGPVTLKAMEKYIQDVEGLLRGATISLEIEQEIHKTRFLTLERGRDVVNITDPIPTHVSAFGPKGRALTARLGAGWICNMSTPDGEAAALASMRLEWARHEHSPSTLYSTVFGGGCVLDPGESPGAARPRAQAGPCAAVAFHSLAEQETHGEGWNRDFPFQSEMTAYRALYQSYAPPDERHLMNHRGHMMFLRPEESHITAAVISAMTLTGTQDQLIERIADIKRAGFDQVNISVPPGQEEDMLRTWSEVISKV